MKGEKFSSMATSELKQKLGDLRKEKFNFAFQKATGQLEKTFRIKQVRRDIARVLTFLEQKSKGGSK